jgi:hypothetical protein
MIVLELELVLVLVQSRWSMRMTSKNFVDRGVIRSLPLQR